jgi:hypothetical protein
MTEFDKEIALRPFADNCRQEGTVRICTEDADRYMNIYHNGATTLHPDDAKALRDALCEAYPLPKAAKTKRPHGPQEYKGNGKHEWEFVTDDFDTGVVTTRLRVPGGWLYRDYGDTDTSHPVFVPVPEAVGYVV